MSLLLVVHLKLSHCFLQVQHLFKPQHHLHHDVLFLLGAEAVDQLNEPVGCLEHGGENSILLHQAEVPYVVDDILREQSDSTPQYSDYLLQIFLALSHHGLTEQPKGGDEPGNHGELLPSDRDWSS